MTAYQVFLLVVLVSWPLVIFGMLFFMNKLENYVNRINADTPEEAGLEPVEGVTGEREVRIRFGDQIVGEGKDEETATAS
jgi:hypothetical protein